MPRSRPLRRPRTTATSRTARAGLSRSTLSIRPACPSSARPWDALRTKAVCSRSPSSVSPWSSTWATTPRTNTSTSSSPRHATRRNRAAKSDDAPLRRPLRCRRYGYMARARHPRCALRAAAAAAGVEFKDQADVLVNTRLAADVVARPRWTAPSGVTSADQRGLHDLTNNSGRSAAAVDAANPRGPNPFGHIIRWREQGNRPWATKFNWDIFVLSGTEADSQVLPAQNGPALTADNIHASADGLWIDESGILWIQTDMSGSQQASGPFGANQCCGESDHGRDPSLPRRTRRPGDHRRRHDSDRKTMFVNFQHPGDRSSRRLHQQLARPRPGLHVIRATDCGGERERPPPALGDDRHHTRQRRHHRPLTARSGDPLPPTGSPWAGCPARRSFLAPVDGTAVDGGEPLAL